MKKTKYYTEITTNGHLQVKQATETYEEVPELDEEGNEIITEPEYDEEGNVIEPSPKYRLVSKQNHRYVLHPGADLTGQPQIVIDAASKAWTPEVLQAYQDSLPPAPTFAETQESLCKRVNTIRYSKIYQESIPYTFPGDTEPDGIQMRDETDRQNIQDFVIDATTKDPATEMNWMPVSNNLKTMTAAQAIAMGQALKARGDAIVAYSWQLKAQINAATTTAELNAINIKDGWPI